MYDICIVGGGAAGLLAAVTAKTVRPSLSVVILERLSRVGKKIAVTGNGRCNITNKNISLSRYHGQDVSFCEYPFSVFDNDETESFFESIGLPLVYEGQKAFPRSLQAASVVDALRFKCDELGVVTLLERLVTDFDNENGIFTLYTEKGDIKSKAVIFATGLMSGGSSLGCDGIGYNILKKHNLDAVAPSPAIVQLKTDTEYVRQIKGIKFDGTVSLCRDGKRIRTEEGEILFCDYGVSGPPVLQISGHAQKGDTLTLDLLPDTDFKSVDDYLKIRRETLKSRKNDEFLSGYINKRLGQVIMKRAGVDLSLKVDGITDGQITKITEQIKKFSLTVEGRGNFANSQVSKGGILTKEFSDKTMMCRKTDGLFAAGELLDIDGDCGGFNLQWAWTSGYIAGKSAALYIGE